MTCGMRTMTEMPVPNGKHGRQLKQEEIDAWRDPALYISVAIGNPRKVKAWRCPACQDIPRPPTIYVGGTGKDTPRYAIFRLADDSLMVAFSGTDVKSAQSVGVNLDLRLAPVDEGQFLSAKGRGVQVHRGFRDTWEKLREEVWKVIEGELKNGVESIVLAGYSLGAGLAFIGGLWLRDRVPEDVLIYLKGYGCPRIGNKAWASLIDEKFGRNAARLVNYKDIVCRIPPPFLGYRHVGYETFILKDGKTYRECHEHECKICSGRFDTRRGWLKLLHAMRNVQGLLHYGPYAGVMLHPDLFVSTSSLGSVPGDA